MKETIFEFYRQYAPDVKLTDDKIGELEQHYQGDTNKFINDFKQKFFDPEGKEFDRVSAAGQAAKIYRAYDEADVEAIHEKEEEERRLKAEQEVELTEDLNPMDALDQFFNGKQTLTQDYHHIKQLISPYGFKVNRIREAAPNQGTSTIPIMQDKLVVTAPNGAEREFFLSTNEADENKNREELTEFFNANTDTNSEEYKQGQERMQKDLGPLGRRYYDAVKLSDEEKKAILDATSELDVFETYKEIDAAAGSSQFQEVKTIQRYRHQDAIDQAKHHLITKEGIENPTDEDIRETAMNILKRKALYDARTSKGNAYLDTLSEDQTRAKTFIAGKLLESSAGKELDKKIEMLELQNDNFDSDPDVIKFNTLMDKYDEYDNTEQMLYNMSDKDREILSDLWTLKEET